MLLLADDHWRPLVATIAVASLISTATAVSLAARATVEYRRPQSTAVAPLLRVLAASVWLVVGVTPGWWTTFIFAVQAA